mmetsp:Transcript_6365/g.15844  ORF Transcript_6365/g.15844 Transcript_6365/m.15844 type:complete len:117 (+) Transcript_6365:243-593(+)|eukprot:CAMPEP_0181126530 /NCGR_PEP_ID=MMETSP1071-20121207/27687_1 /TAXON_ID=35127 /ORGANISM="Thalassiosira sp., Strain NH16" /LENGTH=116 /DNA_ID=CAMNT_0023212155 /DNA_START=208 /DNA_END=558 /DNA_ORIENTATION=+
MSKFSLITGLLCAAIIASAQAFICSNNANVPSALLRSSSLHMTVLTANGKKVDVKEGTPMKAACAKLGVKPKYSCKKGDCGSCTVSVGGSRIKACVGKVPPMPRLKSLQEKGLVVK